MKVVPFDRAQRLGRGPQIVVVLLVVGLAGAMAIEPTRQLLAQKNRIDGMTSDLREIERSNRSLERRIERLRDPAFLEQQARDQGGFLMPGETRVVVLPPEEKKEKRARAAPRRAPKPQPEPSFVEALIDFVAPG